MVRLPSLFSSAVCRYDVSYSLAANFLRLSGHDEPFTIRVAHAASLNEPDIAVRSDRRSIIGLACKPHFRRASLRKLPHSLVRWRFGNTAASSLWRHGDIQELCVAS